MATQREIAEHLDLSDRSVRTLIADGVLPPAEKGELDFLACRIAYIRHLRERAAGRSGEDETVDGLNLTNERARALKERADHQAIVNAKLRNELLPAAEVNLAVKTVFLAVRGVLLRIPAKLSGADSKLRARLTDLINDALVELAETKVAEAIGAGDIDEGDE